MGITKQPCHQELVTYEKKRKENRKCATHASKSPNKISPGRVLTLT